MRYNVIINQEKCKKHGLTAAEGAMMDLFNQLSSWANDEVISGKTYYFISRTKVIEELPFFFSKTDTVYRAFKSLSEKRLIEFKKQNRKDFIRLSALGKGWNKLGKISDFTPNSEKNPTKLGKISENENSTSATVNPQKPTSNSEKNPTYNIYNNTNDNSLKEILKKIEEENAVVFENILTGKTWHERLQISLKAEGLKINFEKEVIPVLLHWLKNKWTSNALDKPLTQLRSEASSYTLKVLQNGGLKTGKQKQEDNIIKLQPQFKKLG
ncbi:hypothetical protein [Mesonia aquimarina]|uniref:hypothetical protein n=1 Tax=Mesonia aquimarina TaxID=1504967 RepID=UPI00196904A6|nr:hypothetical protein [Mesonia aquimarina]